MRQHNCYRACLRIHRNVTKHHTTDRMTVATFVLDVDAGCFVAAANIYWNRSVAR